MVCISTALSLKLQSENAGVYVHFVFIYKSPCKIFIYWPICKIESSHDVMILIDSNILRVNIDIRKV